MFFILILKMNNIFLSKIIFKYKPKFFEILQTCCKIKAIFLQNYFKFSLKKDAQITLGFL